MEQKKTKLERTEQEKFGMRHEYKIIIGIQLSEIVRFSSVFSMCVIYGAMVVNGSGKRCSRVFLSADAHERSEIIEIEVIHCIQRIAAMTTDLNQFGLTFCSSFFIFFSRRNSV